MESNELDLSRIWKKQPTRSSDYDDLINRIHSYKKASNKKKVISNISLTLTALVIISIWVLYKADTVFPKIGMSLIIAAISISLFKFNQFYKSFNELDKSIDSKGYLDALIAIQKRQKDIQGNFINIYFILLSLGLLFYMYEFSLKMDTKTAVVAYVLTFGWVAFVWLYLKPKVAKKQNEKLEKFIDSIEKIHKNT